MDIYCTICTSNNIDQSTQTNLYIDDWMDHQSDNWYQMEHCAEFMIRYGHVYGFICRKLKNFTINTIELC